MTGYAVEISGGSVTTAYCPDCEELLSEGQQRETKGVARVHVKESGHTVLIQVSRMTRMVPGIER